MKQSNCYVLIDSFSNKCKNMCYFVKVSTPFPVIHKLFNQEGEFVAWYDCNDWTAWQAQFSTGDIVEHGNVQLNEASIKENNEIKTKIESKFIFRKLKFLVLLFIYSSICC